MTSETVDVNGPKDGPTATSLDNPFVKEIVSVDSCRDYSFIIPFERKKLGHPSAARLAKRKR